MRSGLWSTIALVVTLGGLYWYIRYDVAKRPNLLVTAEEKVLASIQTDQVDGLRIRSKSGDTTTLEKVDGKWRVVDPVAAPADDTKLTAITSGLPSISVMRVVDEQPTDLESYGLAKPSIDVGFKVSGDKDYRHLLIGETSAFGGDMFAMRSDVKRVVLVSANWGPTFDASTFDLREKALLKFDRSKTDAIDVSAGGKLLRFAKSGREWNLTKPLEGRADYSAVDGLLDRLEAKTKSFVANDAGPADLKRYGLDKPEATVTLGVGGTSETLLVGGKAENGAVYVKDRSRPAVMTAEAALTGDLKKGVDEFRRKDLFGFHPFTADHVEFARNGQTVVFEKIKAPNENPESAPDKWRRASPNPGEVDKDKINGVLTKFESMRASSFIASTAKTGLASPAVTVFVKFDEGKQEERVTFGRNGAEVYAARPDEPGAAKIDASLLNDALNTLDEISK